MARQQKEHIFGAVYHITARGNNKQNIFIKTSDRIKYLSLLQKYKQRFFFKIYAYALMGNHLHLLLEVGHDPLPQIMQCIQRSYALYFNKEYKRVGHVFQQRYRSKICVKDVYLLTLLRYIHQNPVRAGIAKTPDYRWSSHGNYLKGYSDLVDIDYLLGFFAEDKKQAVKTYADFMQVDAYQADVESGYVKQYKDEEMQNPEPEFVQIPGLSMGTLIEAVASETGISAEQLVTVTRARKVVTARNLAIFLAVRNGIARRSELARMFNVSLPRVSRGYYDVLENAELKTAADRIAGLLKQ